MASSNDIMQIEILLTGKDQEVMRGLEKIGVDITDLRETMNAIGEAMAKFGEANIEDEGSLLGATWKPLSQKYLTKKLKMYNVTHLLVATGTLKSDFAWTAHSDRVEVGNNTPYWEYTQRGTSKMAARPTIGFTDDIKHQIINRIRKDIKEKIRLAQV